jgi:DNA-binding transcriptional MerR regulator
MTTEENPEDQPQPEQPGEQSAASKPEDQLQAIIEAAKTSRISPADEDRAGHLLKQTIAGGPKALPPSLDALLSLPWSVGVKAAAEAWPDTKPAGRTRLLNGLAKRDSDASRRIRLSLARGLHPQDAVSALKLIVSVCEAMGGAQGGSSTKDRQIFANVMLGKARPWLMNISMTGMKPAEAQKIITPALESCAQAPIFTQIWVLRWICDAEKFDILPPEHVVSIGKSIKRWQPRWHKELRKIIPKLPESLEAALAEPNVQPSPPSAPPSPSTPATAESVEEASAPSSQEPPAPEPPPVASRQPEQRPLDPRPPEPRHGSSRQPEPQHRSSRDRPQPAPGPFDLNRSLRDIEAYVVRLRSDLQQAQMASRRREPPPDRNRGRMQQPAASPGEIDELRRHNQQIEERNQELRQRIEELTSDHEDHAATLGIDDSLEQFKTFLGLKLKEDFADYTAISREALNEVVRRHAHEILGRIFSVLQAEGVRFDREG